LRIKLRDESIEMFKSWFKCEYTAILVSVREVRHFSRVYTVNNYAANGYRRIILRRMIVQRDIRKQWAKNLSEPKCSEGPWFSVKWVRYGGDIKILRCWKRGPVDRRQKGNIHHLLIFFFSSAPQNILFCFSYCFAVLLNKF